MQVKDRAVCAQKELFMGKVTNKDIAERAGVSAAAVSLAIHGRKGISEATRANILRIVQEMNYAPPSRSCTDSRAVVLIPGAGLRMPPPALLQGIADFAAQQRAQLHILTLQQLMEDFPAKLTGCMLLVTFDELDRSKLDLIASASPDILVLDGNFSRKPFFNVRWDYAAAAYRLVCWLTQLGHRNFVYINEDFSPDKNLIVFSGFQRQILQMHLPLNPVQIVMDAGSDPHVWSHLPEIVRKNNISAIFCTSDRTAVQAADHLLQAGLRIPDDISIAALSVDEPPQHPVYQFTRVGFRSDMLAGSLPALMSARHHFCIVPTKFKAEAVRATICGEIATKCPATALRLAPDARLYLDEDSASLL